MSLKSNTYGIQYGNRSIMALSLIFPVKSIHEPRYEKTGFLHVRKQRRRSAKLISAFVFAKRIVQSLYYLNSKFQASRHLLWLYSLVCVGPGRKPEDRF